MSSHPFVVGAVAEAESALAGGALRATRKAPHYPLSVVAASEGHVLDTEAPQYAQVSAWLRMLLVWTAWRSDDLLRVAPAEVKLEGDMLELLPRRTKTTGPGKRIEVARLLGWSWARGCATPLGFVRASRSSRRCRWTTAVTTSSRCPCRTCAAAVGRLPTTPSSRKVGNWDTDFFQ